GLAPPGRGRAAGDRDDRIAPGDGRPGACDGSVGGRVGCEFHLAAPAGGGRGGRRGLGAPRPGRSRPGPRLAGSGALVPCNGGDRRRERALRGRAPGVLGIAHPVWYKTRTMSARSHMSFVFRGYAYAYAYAWRFS